MEEKVREDSVFYGSENVFADLDLPNPDERLAKAKLASAIQDVIDERGLTQVVAADLMKIEASEVDNILRGRINKLSTEQLLTYLLHLGLNIDIVIHKADQVSARSGKLNVAYM